MAMRAVMSLTKSAFETDPVPLGSSFDQMLSAPAGWTLLGGFGDWNACSKWATG